MKNTEKKTFTSKTMRLVGLGLLTAIIIVLQIFSTNLTNMTGGEISITFALVPIVIGAALYGVGAGAYLGAVFSAMVLILSILGIEKSGALLFYEVNPFLTALLIMLKGTLAGLASGLLYRAFAKVNTILATFIAAIASPLVNTAIFVFGLYVFFRPQFMAWSVEAGNNVFLYFFTFVIGLNFIIEMATNIVLSPIVVRIVEAIKKNKS